MKHSQALLFVLLATVFAAGAGWLVPTVIVHNGSASVPLGFYWLHRDMAKRPIARGDYVVFAPPPAVRWILGGRSFCSQLMRRAPA